MELLVFVKQKLLDAQHYERGLGSTTQLSARSGLTGRSRLFAAGAQRRWPVVFRVTRGAKSSVPSTWPIPSSSRLIFEVWRLPCQGKQGTGALSAQVSGRRMAHTGGGRGCRCALRPRQGPVGLAGPGSNCFPVGDMAMRFHAQYQQVSKPVWTRISPARSYLDVAGFAFTVAVSPKGKRVRIW